MKIKDRGWRKWLPAGAAALGGVVAYTLKAADEKDVPKLRPPHDELGPSFWEQNHWPVLVGAILLVVIVLVVLRLFQKPTVVPVLTPVEEARRALARLKNRPEDGVLLVEVSRILRGYVIAAFQLPREEMTTAEMRNALKATTQVRPDLIAAIPDFLARCDTKKFSPTPPDGSLGAVAAAEELVNKIEAARSPQVTQASTT